MKTMFNLSTRARLILGFGLIIVAMGVIILIAFTNINKIHGSQSILTGFQKGINNLTLLRSEENRLMALSVQMMVDKASVKTLQDSIKSGRQRVDNLERKLDSTLQNSFKTELTRIEDLLKSFRSDRDEFTSLILSNNQNNDLLKKLHDHNEHYNSIRNAIIALEDHLSNEIGIIEKQNQAGIIKSETQMALVGIAMLSISLFFAFWMLGMLRKISREIKDGVVILGTSASEILTTVTEVSTGATETATAVSETTTTVEEVRQTAMVANEKAVALANNSHKAADSGEKGRESVKLVIDAMGRIEGQMKMIAGIIEKLSEQNRTIGEITTSVNDIADQSNLLAVNAAIEAAKAGEQGRGFSVVAQEIRSLAEQSKRATIQVKDMLNDMQRSVNKAVEAIGNGTRAVDEGTRLVAESGNVIDILADNIEDALQSALQISSSSQQQMVGMEQIVPAMGNIKLASEQNVAGIRQTKVTANDLNDLSIKLKEIISRFNL
jgi:methyl-accepting chemotaxis protein